MLKFKGLRLSGFKSFVDRTEIEIGPGLTGIIGPNGCGKSNVLDALRWTMGEGSAKKMRGSEMDDVIFSGSASRSRRRSADVTVILDNSSRQAPSAFNNEDEIEVARRIERDSGSSYKINGRVVRARDVQLLFADTLSGVHSPALVSQGKITNIISAKQHDRRQILEESAGITGLYARRHEAELRLRRADENLLRLQDILENLNTRYRALKRQAGDARKYKALGQEIRELEKEKLYAQWCMESQKYKDASCAYKKAETAVQNAMKVVSQLTQTEKISCEELPEYREKEAEAAASYQAYNLSLQRLDDEAKRIHQQIKDIKYQLSQIHNDMEHSVYIGKESETALIKIKEEKHELETKKQTHARDLEKLKSELENKSVALKKIEDHYQNALTKDAQQSAQIQTLKNNIQRDIQRLESTKEKIKSIETNLEETRRLSGEEPNKLESVKYDKAQAEKKHEKLISMLTDLEGQGEEKQKKVKECQDHVSECLARRDEISHEIKALESISFIEHKQGSSPVINDLKVGNGFEKALGIALGDSLNSSLNNAHAGRIWKEILFSNLPELPENIESLNNHVEAPKALMPALKMIGVVESYSYGEKLQNYLLPGQALVDKSGNYWRWDGYHVKADQQDDLATRQLEQRNRYELLQKKLPESESEVAKAQEKLRLKEESLAATVNEAQEIREEIESTNRRLADFQSTINDIIVSQSENEKHVAKLEEGLVFAKEDEKELEKQLRDNKGKLVALDTNRRDSSDYGDINLEKIKKELDNLRQDHLDTTRKYENARQEESRREARLQALADERVNIQNRSIRAEKHIQDLQARQEELESKLKELESKPESLAQEREKLLESISNLEKKRQDAAEALERAEHKAADAQQALKDAERTLSDSKERRAHAEAAQTSAKENLEKIESGIFDSYEQKPEELLDDNKKSAIDNMSFDSLKKELNDKEDMLALKKQKRDSLGAVNLKADEEIETLNSELEELEGEKQELVKAISELREGIQKLNKEARERLVKAFDTVNSHFQSLFTRLFNGGKAYLSLVDSDDPLESGLEIYAQPPGKSLQSLSLLSGGEQTLTAISLIFAMFLSNPSPICILDEVDAPLDDNNVDRVCGLLEEVAKQGQTRFLVITHHRLTMARMDRLYGITMAEKGVSKLVSLDMNQQLDMLEETTG